MLKVNKNNKNKRHSICFPKFTPKGATSPLRKVLRVDAQESLCSSPKGEITSQARGHLLWDVVVQTSRGAHTREDAPRATPNHLEASFKNNKRKSTQGDAFSALEMKMAALTSQSSSYTLNSCSHPSPSSDPLKKGLGRVYGNSKVCSVWGSQQRWKRGTSVAVLEMCLWELPTHGRNFRLIS